MHYEYAVSKVKCVACPLYLLLITNTDGEMLALL